MEPDGLRVLSGSYDTSVKLWDLVKYVGEHPFVFISIFIYTFVLYGSR